MKLHVTEYTHGWVMMYLKYHWDIISLEELLTFDPLKYNDLIHSET